jgi:TPP-dependent pyruvate/acetoin dehydrogenase alpha subunit
VTAEAADASAAWENPLMPNARLRQIYLAMMQARELAGLLPPRKRNSAGMEACLVSPVVDLAPGDLVSDSLSGEVVEFLRGGTAGAQKSSKRHALAADCGSAARLPEAPGAAERVWMALGAAAGLKAAAERPAPRKANDDKADAEDVPSAQPGVVVVYLLPGELPAALWQKSLTFAAERQLPVIFVVLPPPQAKGSRRGAQMGAKMGTKMGAISSMALRCGVPGIAVDSDDAVAIYRVAQESVIHARTGGGPALLECVPFAIAGSASKRTQPADAIAALEQYMLHRKVATEAWMEREARSFARRAAARPAASK